jgi:hypothetical protein
VTEGEECVACRDVSCLSAAALPSWLRIPPKLRATAAAAVIFAASACNATTAAEPNPSTGTAAPAAAGKPAAGHLLVLSNPGRVTYSSNPSGCHVRGSSPTTILQDASCTPGGIDPQVTQANLASTICRSGYTATVRPPSSETAKAKRTLYTAYGIPAGTKSELDHLVSLELGGDNDVANLWPEVGSIPNPKDRVENALHRAICAGRVKLIDAQNAIATDWTTALAKLGVN